MKHLRYVFLILVLCAVQLVAFAQDAPRVRVACVGNSITYGAGVNKRFMNSYPMYLQQFMGNGYDVRNFGQNGATALNKGDYPYTKCEPYREMLAFNPQIVVVKLGTNDSKPQNWAHKAEFQHDLIALLDTIQALPANPKIYLCLPVPAKDCPGTITDKVIYKEILPIIRKVAKIKNLPLIDLYHGMEPYYPADFADTVHPNAKGASIMAGLIYKGITGNDVPQAHDPNQDFPGNVSQWNGHTRYDFVLYGRNVTVVKPNNPAPGNPWIWRPAFFDAFPSVDKALVDLGYYITYMDLTHLYGSPRSVDLGDKFYQTMHNDYGLSEKVVVEGFSRGGYFAYNWAAKNPEKVACLYIDAPVSDVTSWPGKKDQGLWNGFLQEWGIQDAAPGAGFQGNALALVDPLIKGNVPIMAVCGGADKVVPFKENFQPFMEQYIKRGGISELILKPDCDHHPHSLDDPQPVVDFIQRYQVGYTQPQVINARSLPTNAFHRFITEKRGTVAFLGGSITEMTGWRNMIQEDLKQRFPDTEFTFIDAGIGSTGSTPHAFRMERDVLQKGTPDLMFVEAAVNDDTNHFTETEQIRGMEGIVRHALTVNPNMDIVMMHFIYDPFIPILAEGKTPAVILNHEKVAEYYNISSLNMAQEVSTRMQAGQFDWAKFGGTHPAPFGHRIYTATINNLFDQAMNALPNANEMKKHEIPSQPMDAFSYDKGSLQSIYKANHLKGFEVVEDWVPADSDKLGTRGGFVHVPMLVATKGGSSFRYDFNGRGIGIFCAAGPRSAVLRYRVDKGEWKTLDTHTEWSDYLYIPWVYTLETELPAGPHRLEFRIQPGEKTEVQIRDIVVNE